MSTPKKANISDEGAPGAVSFFSRYPFVPRDTENVSQSPPSAESPSATSTHKERQDEFSQRIENLKHVQLLPDGMSAISKEDAKNYVEHQDQIHANEDLDKIITAKVVMTGMINDVKKIISLSQEEFNDQELPELVDLTGFQTGFQNVQEMSQEPIQGGKLPTGMQPIQQQDIDSFKSFLDQNRAIASNKTNWKEFLSAAEEKISKVIS